MRLLIVLLAFVACWPAAARTPFAGVWLFDRAPSFPGVTMMQVSEEGGAIRGSVTTRWYGPVRIEDARVAGGVLRFRARNLNDRARPMRDWSARLIRGGNVVLTGGIWRRDQTLTGRRGTAAQAEARAFAFAPALPPLGSLPPDGQARTPPMGWSSWNKFDEHIDDATVRAIADAMVSTGLRDAGYVYVNIDDGWQGTRGLDGTLRPNAKFPDMKALADYVHARGLKLGIYSSPGPRTCAGYEGSWGHVAQDARTFAGWGIDYLKYDLCSGEWFYADADSVKRTYYEMGAALRAAGRPILYSLCEYGRFDVADWGRQVGGHLWRTTGDITDTYVTMSDIGFVRNPRFPHAGPGGWNDPDMLEVGNGGMSEDEYRTHMTLWAIQAAPLMMGHDVRRTAPAALRLLTNRAVIAVDQDPLGDQGRPVRRDGGREVWRKRLADGTVAVALFNRGDAPARLVARPADAGLALIVSARDLWTDRDVPGDEPAFQVPAHGAVLLRVRG